ncbi:MAG: hypothetical protein CBC48_11715 [bacterium TMED88]|nr:hypothetical protein [Deltaproteobacteria bacterium]OUV29584.1 MAG: hypothetical protein CBC48_11715 [bacterium TMED88]
MLYASRRSRFSRKKSILYAVLLAVLGLFLNAKCTFTLFLEFDIVLGLSAAWLALFFMRGWWSVFVSIPAAIATVPLYGQPVAALLFVMEVFVVTWIYRNLMADDAVERGHVVFLVILYALFAIGPLYFFGHHYLLGISFDISHLLAYKAMVNSTLCVLLAYFVYVVYKLRSAGRNEYKESGISVSGLIFLSSYGLITFVTLISAIVFFRFYRAQALEMYYDGMSIQANSIWHQYSYINKKPSNAADIQDSLQEGMFFQILENGKQVMTSSAELFNILDTQYSTPQLANEHVQKFTNLQLFLPDLITVKLNRLSNSYYVLSTDFNSDQLEGNTVIKLAQINSLAIGNELEDVSTSMFRFIAFSLTIASLYSFAISSRAEKEINILFSATQPSSSNDLVDEVSTDSLSDVTSIDAILKYSPIREIARGVDIINRSFAELRKSRDSIRVLNAIAQKQLSSAGTIQQSFLVKSPPVLDSIDLSLFMKPAYNAGGDWYDTFSVGNKLFLVIADVCDKGVPAALFMSVFRSLIRYDAVSRDTWDLSDVEIREQMVDVITHVNEYMSKNHGESVMFATVLFIALDQNSGNLSYISAGHESPLIFTPSLECIQLDTTGPAVGIFPNSVYVANSLNIPRGSHFIGFTDGVIDARNQSDESFGVDYLIRLCFRLLSESPDMKSEELMETITSELLAHIGDASQFDDITLATFFYH